MCNKARSDRVVACTLQVKVQPKEVLFRNGEDSQSGIFIVVEGGLGVYLEEGDELRLTNILRTGESVGDLDVLDGKPLSSSPLCRCVWYGGCCEKAMH